MGGLFALAQRMFVGVLDLLKNAATIPLSFLLSGTVIVFAQNIMM